MFIFQPFFHRPMFPDLFILNIFYIGIQRAEIVTCLSSMLFSMLHSQDAYAFSKTNINNVITNPRYLRLATKVADLFTARFNPVNEIHICIIPDLSLSLFIVVYDD